MRFSRQTLSPPLRLAALLGTSCLVGMLLLAGCGEGYCSCPSSKPVVVHLPNLQLLHFMQRNPENQVAFPYPQIQGLASVTPASHSGGTAGNPQILVTVNQHLFALDSMHDQEHIIPMLCNGRPALSPDQQWLLCLANPVADFCWVGCIGTSVSLLSMSNLSHSTPTTIIGTTPPDNIPLATEATYDTYGSPTWSPDGHFLAVIHIADENTACSIDVYAADPMHARFTRTATINPIIGSDDPCMISQIAWSPTGSTLAVVQEYMSSDGFVVNSALSLLPLPAGALVLPASGASRDFTVTTTHLVPNLGLFYEVIWTPNGRSLLIEESEAVKRIDIASQSQTTIFSVPTTKSNAPVLAAIAWNAGYSALLLAFDFSNEATAHTTAGGLQSAQAKVPAICECPSPPAGIYLYPYRALQEALPS
jgi:hypothetical protein